MEKNFISIGKITNFHGISGEAKVGYTQGKEHQFLGETTFYIRNENEFLPLTLDKIRFHKNTAIIKFKELNSVNEVLEYKGKLLYLPMESLRNNLENDEFLVDDLVGVKVFDENGNEIGVVDCIDKHGGNDLLSIKNNDKKFLVPFVKALVPTVDLQNGKIVIHAIEGLVD